MGRGKKTQKLSEAPEWTPHPGAYEVKSEFNKVAGERLENGEDENG